MIVNEHYFQSSTKRLVFEANGRSVTDLGEFASTIIKKKKISETERTKKNNSKKTTTIQEQYVPSITDIHNDYQTNATNSTSTTNITSIVIHNVSLPPITYMLLSDTFPIISRSQPTYAS